MPSPDDITAAFKANYEAEEKEKEAKEKAASEDREEAPPKDELR